MAREHARVKLSIWEDDDFRALSPAAQHLYFVLMIHPKLDYCGVTDWRPGRIAQFAGGWTQEQVEQAAAELSAALYIVIDEEAEEVLLRSFIRSDGLMDSPNLAVAVKKAHTAMASSALRAIVVHELNRLRKDQPDLKGWGKVSELLDRSSLNPSEYPSFNPSRNPSMKGSVSGSVTGQANPLDNPSRTPSPTTAPAPAPNSSSPSEPRKRGERLPENWKPTEQDIAWQRSRGVTDLDAQRWLEKFRNYWTAKSGKDASKLDWSKTWRNWVITEQERQPGNRGTNGRTYGSNLERLLAENKPRTEF